MVVLNWAKRNIALFMTGSHTDYPTYFMIGSGSGTVTTGQTTLISGLDRQLITAVNGSISQKVTWTGDWNSIEMSGIGLREFGLTISGAGITGSMWSATGIGNSVNFNGTSELRIEETWEVF